MERQLGARPRLVVIGHRRGQRPDGQSSEGGAPPRQPAERDNLRAVIGQVALEGCVDDGALGDVHRTGHPAGFERGLQPLQVDSKIRDGLIAKVEILLERLLDDPFERRGQRPRREPE